MAWQSIRGHDLIVQQFRRALGRGRLASTFLFVGPAGIGKRKFALRLAQGLLCERAREVLLQPCGECPSCHQVRAGSHPDVEVIQKPADKAFIPVELLIGDAEHRMRAGLCYNIALKPYSGRRKVAIIDDADFLNKEGANCLLKTLEEPPPKSVLILIGTSPQRQLPTIRSRCQIVRFQPLAAADVAELLVESGACDDPEIARQAAIRGAGSLERARFWCDRELVEFRRELVSALSQSDPVQAEAAKLVGQFVDAAGKESAVKRQRLRLAVSLAEEFYRGLLLFFTTGQPPADLDLARAASTAATWMAGEDAIAACLEICLDAYSHIDANANQGTLIEWWLDELAAAARSGHVAI
jgi:DNA polymerase-3 subunit delta'